MKIIRDPLYGYIDIESDELHILDTWPIQRLRYIKQLAMTHLVYPSACHTRFEHSLGVMHVSGEMAEKLGLSEEDKCLVKIAGLLHDVGHGPFSHVFENILSLVNNDVNHEEITIEVIKETELKDRLNELGLYESIIDILKGDRDDILTTIISSELDADKLDYLRRDSYHTGVEYGKFDFHRIIRTIKVSRDKKYIVIREKGIEAVNGYKLAKYFMHTQVYQHHVRIISDAMLIRGAKLAIEEGALDKDILDINRRGFIEYFLQIHDQNFIKQIIENSHKEAKRIISDLTKRRLFKRAGVWNIDELSFSTKKRVIEIGRKEIEKLEEEIADTAGTDPWQVIIYIQRVENPLYKDPDRYLFSKNRPLLVEEKGREIEYEHVSPLMGVPKKRISKIHVLSSDEHREKVEKAAKSIFK